MEQAWPRVAVVGCGAWGKNLVRNMAELGALAAVVDAHGTRSQGFAEQYGVRAASFEEVLADPGLGAVVIATPGRLHGAQAQAALAAGKHVYVEKPLTLSAESSAALVARAADRGRVLMVGHILRHHGAFRRLLALVEDGAIGRVRHAVSTRFNLGRILEDEDVLWALGPHDLSMVVALLGEAPGRVQATADAFLRTGIADVATLKLSYGEASAEVRLNWLAPVKEHRLTVWGERGVLVFDDTRPWAEKLVLHRPALDWAAPVTAPAPGTPEAVPLEPAEPLKDECRNFLEAAAGRAPCVTPGVQAIAIARLLERAQASIDADGAAR